MLISGRLRQLRLEKNFSQGEMEKRTGLLRCYTSRVENGHTIPTVETLEKYARALEVPMYRLFYDGKKPPRDVLPSSKLDDRAVKTAELAPESIFGCLAGLRTKMQESEHLPSSSAFSKYESAQCHASSRTE
jgi:transcriptional regulator with XRE-family HTH domain